MAQLLKGLRVVVAGSSRPVLAAARWYRELGAQVLVRPGPGWVSEADRLWLGVDDAAPRRVAADVLVADADMDTSGLTARVRVRHSGSGSRAPRPDEAMDGRALAAAGGVAVAIGEPDRGPLPVPEGCLEHMVGSHLAAAGLAALLDGTREVEVAGVDVVAWSVATNANLYVPYGVDWYRGGSRANGGGGGYPYGVFDVADGQFCLIGRTSRDWDVFLDAMGSPPWAQDPRYLDRRAIGQDYPEEVDALLEPWLSGLTRAELLALAAERGFPGGPVLRPDEVLTTPTLEDRWRETTAHGRRVRVPGPPVDVVPVAGTGRPVGPLSELLVLDLSWVWSGPAAAAMLADLGATVVKVESSTRPDNSRLRGGPTSWSLPPKAPPLEVTPYFHATNRGKRSVSLDLTTDQGRRLLQQLAAQADVIIENLSPGVMHRFGIAPEQVHESNPDCVFMSLRGYRPHASTAGLRAYAPVLSGGAGIEALVRYDDEPPIGMMTYGFSDANAASQAALLSLAALWGRRERSCGSQVTLSQLEAAVVANGHNLVAGQLPGGVPRLQPFAGDHEVVGFEALPEGPWTSADLFTTVSSPWVGDLLVSRLPWRRDGELPPADRPGPVLGGDNRSVLGGRLGLSDAQLRRLAEAGVLA